MLLRTNSLAETRRSESFPGALYIASRERTHRAPSVTWLVFCSIGNGVPHSLKPAFVKISL